jgi:diadenosine tetraphosphate (Ap4A) HIT family hydrolase
MDEQCANCPYCGGIPGVGPRPVSAPKTRFDRVLYETPEIVLTPTLGMIVPGSFLIVSKIHVHGFASLSEESLIRVDSSIRYILGRLRPLFGDYLVFEHGSPIKAIESHGGCIMHAHFHLFPTAKETGPMILSALPWQELGSLFQLSQARGLAYALVGLDGHYSLSKSPRLPSQWIRRVVVDSLNSSKHWDWGVEFGYKELEETLAKLSQIDGGF